MKGTKKLIIAISNLSLAIFFDKKALMNNEQ